MKHLTVKEQELRAKALAFNPNIALWFGIKDTTIVRDGEYLIGETDCLKDFIVEKLDGEWDESRKAWKINIKKYRDEFQELEYDWLDVMDANRVLTHS